VFATTDAHAASQQDESAGNYWRAANGDALLNHDELTTLQNKAIDGDGDAAYRVQMHYAYGELDPGEAVMWQTIAIEDGSTRAMYDQARKYMHSKDARARRRARYWFARLKDDPEFGTRAKGSLKEMDNQRD